jgi:hypothetical protein
LLNAVEARIRCTRPSANLESGSMTSMLLTVFPKVSKRPSAAICGPAAEKLYYKFLAAFSASICLPLHWAIKPNLDICTLRRFCVHCVLGHCLLLPFPFHPTHCALLRPQSIVPFTFAFSTRQFCLFTPYQCLFLSHVISLASQLGSAAALLSSFVLMVL